MDRLYTQQFQVTAGTAVAAPMTLAWPMETARLGTITITVPDGHSGLTGLHVLYLGTLIVPYRGTSWLVANDAVIAVPFNDEVMPVGMTLEAYNLDVFDHTFYLRADLSNVVAASPVLIVAPQASASLTDDTSSAVTTLTSPQASEGGDQGATADAAVDAGTALAPVF